MDLNKLNKNRRDDFSAPAHYWRVVLARLRGFSPRGISPYFWWSTPN